MKENAMLARSEFHTAVLEKGQVLWGAMVNIY